MKLDSARYSPRLVSDSSRNDDFPVVTEHPAFESDFGLQPATAALETILVRVQNDAHER
jgi:hypothetical protein